MQKKIILPLNSLTQKVNYIIKSYSDNFMKD